jgi:multidrug efflux system membrane fusion protein
MDDRTKTDHEAWPAPQTRPALPPPARKPVRRQRRPVLVGIVVVLLVAALAWWLRPQPVPPSPGRGGIVPPVSTAAVRTGDINVTINALGTVTSLATVTIRSQISGQLVRIAFTEGQTVKKGDLLAEIDSRPYQLALAQAQGALKRDQALLQAAQLDLERYQKLAQTNAIPRQQLDTQQALVLQDQGNVLSDQAQIDTAQLNITYCHIVSPLNGRVGLRQVDQGNYVTPGDPNGLVVVTQLSPISVLFTTAEDNLPAILKRVESGATLPITAYDRSGTTKIATGELLTFDNQIDTTTGTVRLRAQFANEQNTLFPNQFVNVELLVDVLKGVTVMPTSAVQRGAPGTFVYLVQPDNTVKVRVVELGPVNGESVAVKSGLAPGDRVVVDGADKLRDGIKITVREPGSTDTPPAPAAGTRTRAPRTR